MRVRREVDHIGQEMSAALEEMKRLDSIVENGGRLTQEDVRGFEEMIKAERNQPQ
jgi:hypothetical protein